MSIEIKQMIVKTSVTHGRKSQPESPAPTEENMARIKQQIISEIKEHLSDLVRNRGER